MQFPVRVTVALWGDYVSPKTNGYRHKRLGGFETKSPDQLNPTPGREVQALVSFKASQDARRGPEAAVLGKRTFFRDCGLRGNHRITRVFRDNALLLQGQQEASAFPRFQDLSSRGIGLFPVSFWGPALRVMGARLPGPGAPRPLLLQLGVTKVTTARKQEGQFPSKALCPSIVTPRAPVSF